jgi:hypothetical protein
MPTSKPDIISPVAKKIMEINPLSVLDIGVGHGKWGFLAREYTDIWNWRHYKPEWKARIDGIEIFEKYRNPVWAYAYDNIYIGNARDVLKTLPQYDLCVMIDVLEHFTKEDGLGLVSQILATSKSAIISYSNCPQGSVRGNDHEEHLSEWTQGDFEIFEFGGRKIQSLYRDDITNALYFFKP